MDIREKVPILYNNKNDCCGCSACAMTCPMNAISMVEDKEGFLYPHICETRCVGCKKCLDVCSFKKEKNKKRS